MTEQETCRVRFDGVVKRVVYHKDETNFYILKVEPRKWYTDKPKVGKYVDDRLISVKVNYPGFVSEMGDYEICGDEIVEVNYKGKYTLEIKAKYISQVMRPGKEGFVYYVSGDKENFKGIGEKLAAKIYDRFGGDVWNIIETKADELVALVGEKRAAVLQDGYLRNIERTRRMTQIAKYFGMANAAKIVTHPKFGDQCVEIMHENPYRFIRIRGIGFKACDTAFMAIRSVDGPPKNHPNYNDFIYGLYMHDERIRAGVLYVLDEYCEDRGHTMVPLSGRDGLASLLWNDLGFNAKARVIVAGKYGLTDPSVLVVDEEGGEPRTDAHRAYDAMYREMKKKLFHVVGGMRDDEAVYYRKLVTPSGRTVEYLQSASFFRKEEDLAEKLFNMAATKNEVDMSLLDTIIDTVEKEESLAKGVDFRYSEEQRQAIYEANRCRVIVLQGKAGTGKTTVQKAIIRTMELMKLRNEGGDRPVVTLCALSAKAAEVMKSATGRAAATIHRTLDYGREGNGKFSFNAANPLKSDIVVLDEASMVGTFEFHALVQAVPYSARLVIVGDPNQLESISAGKVLQDLLDSEVVPVIRLTRIYRQSAEKKIVEYAHETLGYSAIDARVGEQVESLPGFYSPGDVVEYPFFQKGERTLWLRSTVESVADGRVSLANGTDHAEQDVKHCLYRGMMLPSPFEFPEVFSMGFDTMFINPDRLPDTMSKWRENPDELIARMVTETLPRYAEKYGLTVGPKGVDFKVLCPNKSGAVLSVEELNNKLQERLNPGAPGGRVTKVHYKEGEVSKSYLVKVGDPVIHIKNNPTLGVFNGDVGVVSLIGPDECVITYNGEPVKYKEKELAEVRLCYAMTTHKSQGSEYEVVFLAVPKSTYPGMLTNNFLYTGITRAKKILIFIGEEAVLNRGLARRVMEKRRTGLLESFSHRSNR